MIARVNILFRNTAAIFLLSLLAIVYAEKVLHKHTYHEPVSHELAGIDRHYDYASCHLCDFQPVGACTVPEIRIGTPPCRFVETGFSVLPDRELQPCLSVQAGRGPPAA